MADEPGSTRWYAAGLHFGCAVCGRCCAGPGEGYIWVLQPEIERIAGHLGLTPEEVRERFLRRINHPRWTREDLPEEGDGVAFFRNAYEYCREL